MVLDGFGEVWEGPDGGRTTLVVARGTSQGQSDGQVCSGSMFPALERRFF